MPEIRYFSVVNLGDHQHYRDRNPPWIKLHTKTLESYDFGRLQDASKAHLMLIWLLASRTENRIPYDPIWVGGAIHAREPVDLDALQAAGFIAVEGNACGALAERLQDARPEREGEGETEGKVETRKRARATGWRDEDTVPTEWMQWAQDELKMTPAQTYAQRDRFVDHFIATGKTMKNWKAAWRNWCRRALSDFAPRSSPNGNGGPPAMSPEQHRARERQAPGRGRPRDRAP